jgi:Tol biopolymer transport system component
MNPKLLPITSLLAALALLLILIPTNADPPPAPMPLSDQPLFIHSPGTTTRVSVSSDGTQAGWDSHNPVISADGRYVAFESGAELVPDDINGVFDVYVHDRQTGQTSRVSVSYDGTHENDDSGASSALSADGRYVVFYSEASNLVPDDTNSCPDLFLHDQQTGQTTDITMSWHERPECMEYIYLFSISPDARYIAFHADWSAGGSGDCCIAFHDRQTGQTSLLDVSDNILPDTWGSPSISADGRYVAFGCELFDLSAFGACVHDRQTGQTTFVSFSFDGTPGNYGPAGFSLSADGRYVAYSSRANNLVPGDTNDCEDIFFHDRQTGLTTRISVASDGTEANGESGYPSISADGRYVAFWSEASNLVLADSNDCADIFIHDRETGLTSRVSVASDGTQGNTMSGFGGFYFWRGVSISADGRSVAFDSTASNLVGDDTNGRTDIFVHNWEGGGPPPECIAIDPVAHQPVLIVPGWGGCGGGTCQDEPNFQWLQDILSPDYVVGCNLFFADKVNGDNSTAENAQKIQDALRDHYAEIGAFWPGWQGHFDLIGHSYGGLRARAYLEGKWYAEDQQLGIHVDNLFTLGSPHGGVRLENLEEVYPGSMVVGGGHILKGLWEWWTEKGVVEFLSTIGLEASVRDAINFTNQQPAGVCYRLIGGDFAVQTPHSWQARLKLKALKLYYRPWEHSPNDIGVSHRSATWLAIYPELGNLYPNTLAINTDELHDYIDRKLGPIPIVDLKEIYSYLHYEDNQTLPYIKAHLGDHTCSGGQKIAQAIVPHTATLASPTLLLTAGDIEPGQTATGTFQVDWQASSAVQLITWGDPLLFGLTDPSGVTLRQEITPTADSFYLTLGTGGSSTSAYYITDTLSGEWTYVITNTDTMSKPYELQAIIAGELGLALSALEWLPAGEPAVITATVYQTGSAVLSTEAMTASIGPLDGQAESLPLYDDGAHHDGAAGDGTFGATYMPLPAGGEYWLDVSARGTVNGHPFRRTAGQLFSIASPVAALTGDYTDAPADPHPGGMYATLVVSCALTVTQVGTYTLAADLVGPDGVWLDHAISSVPQVMGTVTVPLQFSGRAIWASGLDGPYTLSHVLLVDESSIFLKLDEAFNVHQTAAYDHDIFRPRMPVYLPLVVRQLP